MQIEKFREATCPFRPFGFEIGHQLKESSSLFHSADDGPLLGFGLPRSCNDYLRQAPEVVFLAKLSLQGLHHPVLGIPIRIV